MEYSIIFFLNRPLFSFDTIEISDTKTTKPSTPTTNNNVHNKEGCKIRSYWPQLNPIRKASTIRTTTTISTTTTTKQTQHNRNYPSLVLYNFI